MKKSHLVLLVVLIVAVLTITLAWLIFLRSRPPQGSPNEDATSVADDLPVPRAIAAAQQGDIDGAVKLLGNHLKKNPEDMNARMILGQVHEFAGRADSAIEAWKDGLAKKHSDFPLLMAIAERYAKQGSDGPNVEYKQGSVTYHPTKDEKAETAYKEERKKLALVFYRRAVALKPDDATPLRAAAQLESELGRFDDATKTWEQGSKMFPADSSFELGWAQALVVLKKDDDAAKHFESALTLNPRLAEAHTALSDYFDRKQRPDDARVARYKAAFYKWVPECIPLTYSDSLYAKLKVFGIEGTENEPRKDLGQITNAIALFKKDQSVESTGVLAALCHRHEYHGPIEDGIYAELETRGPAGSGLLLALLSNAQSTCTARNAAFGLARAKDSRLLPLLLRALPGDNRAMFFIDVAGALRELGDNRAVKPLLDTLNSTVQEKSPGEEDDPMQMAEGRRLNRIRCALALSAFDTPEVRAALEKGRKNPQVSLGCDAALYIITREPNLLESIRTRLSKKPDIDLMFVCGALRNVSTAEAKALVQQFDAKLKSKER